MAARLTAYLVVGIVAATLIAGLMVGAQRDDSDGPIDIIIHNAAIYTAGPDAEMADALAIRGNQVLQVGGEREILRLRRPQTNVIDARGAAVLPGFNDAHLHPINGGISRRRIDLTGAASTDEIQERIRDWATRHPDSAWVLGGGWNYDAFAGGLPTRQQLDAIVSDRPAQIVSHDNHTAWVNTKALKLAGITRNTPNPPQGTIVKDSRTGEPTGVLKEAAMQLVGRHVPPLSRAERVSALRDALAEAHRYGITSVQSAGDSPDDLEIYEDARRAGDLALRVYSALAVDGPLDEAELSALETTIDKYPDDPLFKAGAIKITLDGVVESSTALMLAPYASGADPGTPSIDVDEYNRLVRLLDSRGWQVMTHAVGDGAVRMALNAYEHAVRSNPRPARGRRHRIEHAELVDAADIPRFGALGVVAAMMPFHGSPSPSQVDLWSKNLGPDRVTHGWPYASLAAKAAHLAFGSDWPGLPLDPMQVLHTAVNRTTPDNLPEGGWSPSERLALEPAIDAYTSGAAWASFDEQRKGHLAPGMLADVVVLSENIFEAPTTRLASTRVALTIFDGKIVYRRDGATTN